MNKIHLFKDQEDVIFKITDDPVMNIIGTKGSGKTTTSLEYIEDNQYITINLDCLFECPGALEEDKELPKVRDMLKKKYGSIQDGEDFIHYYYDIIDYILTKKKKAVIEGNSLQNLKPDLLKGKILVKRTSVFKSFIRAVRRDYKNEYFMNLEKEKHKYFYKLTRFYKITKRRIKIFKQAKEIEKIYLKNT